MTYTQATATNQRPSAIVNLLEDPYVAYCFDEACLAFGRGCEAAMDSVKTAKKKPAQIKGARENMLRRFLGIKPKFADIGRLRGGAGQREAEPSGDRPEPDFRME
jgi:hypothetical protein